MILIPTYIITTQFLLTFLKSGLKTQPELYLLLDKEKSEAKMLPKLPYL
jgi:hypothetical protein